MSKADAIIQVSNSYAQNTNKIFWPKTYVIENGIELDEWKRKNIIKLPGENKYKVVFIGRLEYQKNIQTILQIDIPENIDLIIIGGHKGSAAELEDKVLERSKRDKNFIYIGPKYDQEKVDHLFAADAVLVPSLHEPFGIVALEALASQSVLLSSFVSGMGDFLNKDCAINCGISKESIEAALKQFINLKNDQKKEMIQKGLDVCKNYTWQKSAQKLESIYKLFKK
jgi:glycosyltransferase involved in cell wall biosynthesis